MRAEHMIRPTAGLVLFVLFCSRKTGRNVQTLSNTISNTVHLIKTQYTYSLECCLLYTIHWTRNCTKRCIQNNTYHMNFERKPPKEMVMTISIMNDQSFIMDYLLCKLINSTSDKILELNADGQGGVGTYLIIICVFLQVIKNENLLICRNIILLLGSGSLKQICTAQPSRMSHFSELPDVVGGYLTKNLRKCQ